MARYAIHTDKQVEKLKAVRLPLSEYCKKEINGKLHTCSRSYKNTCEVYAFPKTKWLTGDCPMADDELRTMIDTEVKPKVRVGQQKQKKRK